MCDPYAQSQCAQAAQQQQASAQYAQQAQQAYLQQQLQLRTQLDQCQQAAIERWRAAAPSWFESWAGVP